MASLHTVSGRFGQQVIVTPTRIDTDSANTVLERILQQRANDCKSQPALGAVPDKILRPSLSA